MSIKFYELCLCKVQVRPERSFFPLENLPQTSANKTKNAFPEATTMMLNFAVLQINFSCVSLAKSTDLIVFSYCGVSME